MSESAFSNRIVQSLLDTDFYKLTMMQAVLHNYPNVDVEWEFRCRNGEDLRPYLGEIKHQIELLCELSLTPEHLVFLERITFIKPDFLRFLGLFRFNTRYVKTTIENDELCIRLHGPWLHVILFEVPLLAIVSEVRNRHRYPDTLLNQARDRLYEKFEWLTSNATPDELAELKVADFGTRRRFSYRVQEEILGVLKNDFPGQFVGTSNVHLARQLDLKPLGTMAHEWIMAHQQLGPRLIDSQIAALDCWVREYRGLLGIALTDCITTDAFLNDFDLYFAKLFDGLRHDSGDPVKWAEKCIAHYQKLGIDPMSKTLVFSDGLNLQKSLEIFRALRGRINVSFGIGTNLTADIPGIAPMNMVLKMTACAGQAVAKISDEPGKTQCKDPNFVAYLRHVFKVPALPTPEKPA
ncbi:nicotinate phosphoribosyltransferase [Pseudomonas cannabina]|uniref:Nicotinate phosphoribosyltransferase n=3 Tax=Pseudomonas syringae group TaxID=136849 RepID=A0A3M3Q788_PSECA|nr:MULTISPECIES: nicotinate phosphoribosyltransferase [Pseudomonas syringae group]KPB69293.1 Nicotinate phosphoribosyltransferase [Pseudomonas syringae pv. maculicola]KPW23824.1 Nicotinate phosphoribosyltransferase [Pseudomonas cannabina pv. alisalensis]MBM0138495.1 nicotinate phosphoribosyltransferase [Pseudomonas cannabina pv. alisalensis]QHE99242.1 nicotinate phosphoribosyltransferase [Pseudomonas syringae pv. maculicola str. ES4326]QQN21504.1 nicotinate phosphoribosyltransferase [Pseudomon